MQLMWLIQGQRKEELLSLGHHYNSLDKSIGYDKVLLWQHVAHEVMISRKTFGMFFSSPCCRCDLLKWQIEDCALGTIWLSCLGLLLCSLSCFLSSLISCRPFLGICICTFYNKPVSCWIKNCIVRLLFFAVIG